MVRRIALFLTAVSLAMVALACGGGNDSDTSTRETPVARSTATTPARPPTGPQAVIEPREGPPGTRVTITGTGWQANEAIDILGAVARGETPPNYGSVTADAGGGFTFSFRLETGAGGVALQPGRFDVIVKSSAREIGVPFLVESRRPVGGGGPGG